MERHADEPELVAVLEDQHDEVALPYALGRQVVAGLVAEPLDVGERELPAFTVLVLPYHSEPLRIVHGDVVDYVVTEVEIVGAVDVKMLEETVLVERLPNVPQVDVPHGHSRVYSGTKRLII